ncbi:MAG: B12-binding domain-containing radical SAM protein [Deltaproteobacteria bacterium]|nr:B12-binding domain-containing radical SAM protein [Deltaproteobacteria bacterium]
MPRILLVETCTAPRRPASELAAEHRARHALALESVVDGRRDGARGVRRDMRGGELALFGIPLGGAYLAPRLLAHGIEVLHEPLALHAAAGRDPLLALGEAVRRGEPDVVGITINHTVEESVGLMMARVVKATRPGVKVVLGGMDATFRAHVLAHEPAVDAIVRFEGEESLPRCVDWLTGRGEPDDVAGLVARVSDEVRLVPPGPHIDFARAVPAYDVMRADEYVRAGVLAHVQTSRGCPHECHFCCHTTYWGRGVRVRDVGLVAEEVADLLGRGCDLVYLTDSTFTLDGQRVEDMCDAFVAHGDDRATFAVETRIDRLDDRLLARMARAGVRIVALGVESVSPEVLARLPDKRVADPLASVRDAVRRLRAHGMSAYVSLVLGLPGETAESLRGLIDAVDLLYADTDGLLWADAKLARAFPGSAFADDPARLHATVDARYEWYDFYGRVTVHVEGGPTEEEILAAREAVMERNVRAWRRRRPGDEARVREAVAKWMGGGAETPRGS